MQAWMLLLCIGSVSPLPVDQVTTVEVIELNRLYDESGEIILTQWIFWDRDHLNNYQVVDWRMHKSQHPARLRRVGDIWEWTQVLPAPNVTGGRLEGHRLIHVQAPEFRETWTRKDPEVENRAVWPRDYRRELGGPLSVQEMMRHVSPKTEKEQ